jgi:MYXO-CTERM domain-containing protein
MDFFETLFGLSPDGGDGSTEVMWVGAIAVAAAAFLFRRRILAWVAARRGA